HQFLETAGVITGYDAQGLPIYNDFFLCFDPHERLYLNGNWQTDLIPRLGLPPADQAEITRFLQQMEQFRLAKGADGRDAFTIPVDNSSKDATYTALDSLTMEQWLEQQQLRSAYLRWYVNYCMRDDFGTTAAQISAWTGIHYYASRKGKGANARHYDVLTWPQGNGWLVEQLCRPIGDKLKPNALAIRIVPSAGGTAATHHPAAAHSPAEVHYYDTVAHQVKALHAKHVIVAVPQFVANRLLPVEGERARIVKEEMHYTPWMVANLTVGNLVERTGAPLSWDNVLYGGESLGYVEATHQQIQQLKEKKVLTYYWPLTHTDPAAARQWAFQRKHADWVGDIVGELRKVHPDIEEQTENIDIMLWGHAMTQPRPGWIHGGHRQLLQESYSPNIHFAHTDLAGISIFEEGFYQGIKAANKILGGPGA
ncbi:MAG TPA: hypothetical protein VKQ52_00755, partial [Puia sp.]|nr:hypothetical protein [Puia sp.]